MTIKEIPLGIHLAINDILPSAGPKVPKQEARPKLEECRGTCMGFFRQDGSVRRAKKEWLS